jgi:hypothetical protein
MSWKEIEKNWAAMARRVRSDLSEIDTVAVLSQTPKPANLSADDPDQLARPPIDRQNV